MIVFSFISTPAEAKSFKRKLTSRFEIRYNDKYIDVEKIYSDLSEELNIQLDVRGPKYKIYIIDNPEENAYAHPSAGKIVIYDVRQLRHELTHLMFYTLGRNAPLVLQEGIASYKEANTYPKIEASLDDIIAIEESKADRQPHGIPLMHQSYFYDISCAWVGRLVEAKGIEKFKELYKLCGTGGNGNRLRRSFHQVYGR